ncbi:MAG: hypothetical protein GC172_13840 [Phycisphaera sp.]|nr:hypothetical protein [Phycisphaera sp.]
MRSIALLALLVAAMLSAAGCGRETGEFERIAQPARFALVRETAQWTPGFDPSWWPAIDDAYAQFDADAERIVRTRWSALALEAAAADQAANPPEPEAAGAWRGQRRAIDAELAAAERDFIARIDAALPASADRFIALLAARIECARAAAVWEQPARPLPGPLEVLSRVGVHAAGDAEIDAAIDAYGRIAREARRLTESRFTAYIAWTEDFGGLSAALDQARQRARAETGKPEGPRVEEAQEAFEARTQAMRAVRAETTESLRLLLLAAGDAFAAVISDESVRAEFTERLEADLHERMSTTRTMMMYGRLAERAILAAHPDDPARLEAFRADLARGLELQRTRRAALRSTDEAERRAAYRELSEMPSSILSSASSRLGDRLGWRLFWQAVAVDLGRKDEDEAFAAIFAEDPPPIVDAAPADADPALIEAMGSAEQLAFVGTALSPRVLRRLAQELALDPAREAQLDARVAEESSALAEVLREASTRIEAAARGLGGADGAPPDEDARRRRVRDAMQAIRGSAAAVLSRSRAANTRVLDEFARLGGVAREHPVLVEAAVELELLALIGSRGLGQAQGRSELERFAGVTVESYSSPFEIARTMDASEADRGAALALIAARGAELIEVAEATRAAMLDNLERFLDAITRGPRRGRAGEPPWRASLASQAAVDLRFAIPDDLGEVLGPAVAQAYERRWRALEQPALAMPRAAGITRLGVTLARGELDPVTDSALRAALAVAEARHEAAARAAHRWRAAAIVRDRMDSVEQWRDRAFDEPLGVYLFGRIEDADARALALCEAIAASTGATERVSDATRIRERPIVSTFRPR